MLNPETTFKLLQNEQELILRALESWNTKLELALPTVHPDNKDRLIGELDRMAFLLNKLQTGKLYVNYDLILLKRICSSTRRCGLCASCLYTGFIVIRVSYDDVRRHSQLNACRKV